MYLCCFALRHIRADLTPSEQLKARTMEREQANYRYDRVRGATWGGSELRSRTKVKPAQ